MDLGVFVNMYIYVFLCVHPCLCVYVPVCICVCTSVFGPMGFCECVSVCSSVYMCVHPGVPVSESTSYISV